MSRAREGSEKSFASAAACVPESSLVHRSLPSFLCRRMAWMVVGRGGGRRVPSLFLEGMRAVCVCVCFCWKNIRRRLEHVRPPHLFSTLERIGEFSSSVSSSSLFPSPLPRAGPLFDCSARYGWTLLLLPEAKGGGGCRVYGICGRLAERKATSPLFPCGKNRGDKMATIHIWGNFNSEFQHVKQGSKRAVFLFMLFCQARLLKE